MRLRIALVPVALVAASLVLAAGEAGAAQPAGRPEGQAPPARPTRGADQAAPAPEPGAVRLRDPDDNADRTKDRLENLLERYPPSLRQVLRLDPTLIVDQGYLRTYPELAAYLAEHPEIARNPTYFFGEARAQTRPDSARLVRDMISDFMLMLAFLTVVGVLAWLVKYAIDYRRWMRHSRVQTEAHTKLLDRLTSNEDLLAYIQSPAGRRYLESAPIPLESPTSVSAPAARILWSVQAGTIAALVGLGLLFVSRYMSMAQPGGAEIVPVFFAFGIIVLAVGLGFILSAVISYLLSRRLGLLAQTPATVHD